MFMTGKRPILGINVPYNHGTTVTRLGWQKLGAEADAQAKMQASVLAPLLMQGWAGTGMAQQAPPPNTEAYEKYDHQARRALAGLDSYVRNRETGQVEQWTPALQSQFDGPLQWYNERRFARKYVPLSPQMAQRHFGNIALAFRPAPSPSSINQL